MREFLPLGQVTGIGSLPHRDANDAIRFVAEHSPTIPFWPQLPQRSDDEMMLPQMLAPLFLPSGRAEHQEVFCSKLFLVFRLWILEV